MRPLTTARCLTLVTALAACNTDQGLAPSRDVTAGLAHAGVTTLTTRTPSQLAMVPGYAQGAAYAIDGTGNTVVGEVWNAGDLHQAVVWTGNAPVIITPPAGMVGGFLVAQSTGVFVGAAMTSSGDSHAIKATTSGATRLADSGYVSSAATAVWKPLLGTSVIVGSVEDAAGNDTPVKWAGVSLRRTALPLPSGYVGGYAEDIDDQGNIVGAVYTAGGQSPRAYRWSSKGGGSFLAPAPSIARTSTSAGTIGLEINGGAAITNPPYATYAVLWTGNVWDVNALGRVVGNNGGAAHTWRNGVTENIAYPLATSSWARDVNTCGTIVGQAWIGGLSRPVQWTVATCE